MWQLTITDLSEQPRGARLASTVKYCPLGSLRFFLFSSLSAGLPLHTVDQLPNAPQDAQLQTGHHLFSSGEGIFDPFLKEDKLQCHHFFFFVSKLAKTCSKQKKTK